jgi:hypothetical protein
LSFDGLWYGRYDGELRGTINGNTLTWGNGADSGVTYDSGNIHLGPFVGQITSEGLINWDDGDIWINYDFQAPTTRNLFQKLHLFHLNLEYNSNIC